MFALFERVPLINNWGDDKGETIAKEDFDEIGVPLSSAVQVPAADCIHYGKLVAAGLASRVGDHSLRTPFLNYGITKHALDVGEYTVRASHGSPVADMKLHTDPMKLTVVQLTKSLLDNGWKPHDAQVKGKVAPATPRSIETSKVVYLLRKSKVACTAGKGKAEGWNCMCNP